MKLLLSGKYEVEGRIVTVKDSRISISYGWLGLSPAVVVTSIPQPGGKKPVFRFHRDGKVEPDCGEV